MKKLSLVCALTLLIAHPHQTHANDEWELATCFPLAITTGALALSLCYIYKQAGKITRLQNDLNSQKTVIESLTKERDEKTKSISTWHTIFKTLHQCIPFLGVKESVTPPQYIKLFNATGFEKSKQVHKIPGLVTFISKHPNFTPEEKNMISDEENSLEERDQLLEEVDAIISGVQQKIGEF